jgi:putative transposase
MYFVTTLVRKRACVLSRIEDGRTVLTDVGVLVDRALMTVVDRCHGVELNAHVIMPDHVHLIVRIAADNAVGLPRVVGMFKGLSARWINLQRQALGIAFWQRSFQVSVLHTAYELVRARLYVANNPRHWHEHPHPRAEA